jgi:hypothetical protein
MTFHRNWAAVCKLTNKRLQLVVALTTDRETLEGLRRGFPNLFTDEPLEQQGPWPLSVLRRVIEDGEASEEGDASTADDLFDRVGLNIPHVVIVSKGFRLTNEGDIVATAAEAEMISGRFNKGGYELFPHTLDRITVGGIECYPGPVMNESPGDDSDATFILCAWPCALVDENT